MVFLGSDGDEQNSMIIAEMLAHLGEERALPRASPSDDDMKILGVDESLVVFRGDERFPEHDTVRLGTAGTEDVLHAARDVRRLGHKPPRARAYQSGVTIRPPVLFQSL